VSQVQAIGPRCLVGESHVSVLCWLPPLRPPLLQQGRVPQTNWGLRSESGWFGRWLVYKRCLIQRSDSMCLTCYIHCCKFPSFNIDKCAFIFRPCHPRYALPSNKTPCFWGPPMKNKLILWICVVHVLLHWHTHIRLHSSSRSLTNDG